MLKHYLAIALAAILLAEPVTAAEREVMKTDWNGFEQQVSTLRLAGRSARIRLTGGAEIKTNLLQVTGSAAIVRATRATKQWDSGEGKAQIPGEQVASVRFGGRMGGHGLVGGLAGLGAGAGAGAAIAASSDITEGVGVILIPALAAAIAFGGAIAGYFIGRSTGRPAPEFLIVH